MGALRRFRFTVQAGAPPAGSDWPSFARRLESIGYGGLVMADHVVGNGLSPLPALAAAATATRTLRVGTLVLDNDFRNPLLLAREAATVDVISNGRLELGIGAGWHDRDNGSLGIAYDPPRVRVERLAEAVPLLKRFWAEETVTHAGRYYRHEAAHSGPKPVQRPHPPLVVGPGPSGPRSTKPTSSGSCRARGATAHPTAPRTHGRPRWIGSRTSAGSWRAGTSS